MKYYTTVRDMRDVYVVGGQAVYLPPRAAAPSSSSSSSSSRSPFSSSALPSPAVAADALVTTRFLGYSKVWRSTNRVFDSVDLHLPDVQLRTRAAFCRVPASAASRCRDELGMGRGGGREGGSGSGEGGGGGGGPEAREGLHAACHALVAAAPAVLGCDSADFGTECDSPYDSRFRPMRLLLWEKNGSGSSGSGGGGGGGLAERAADAFGELLAAALDIVSNCSLCAPAALPSSRNERNGERNGGSDPGCPECTFWAGCSEYNAVLHRGAAKIVLEETIRAAAAAAAFGGGGGGGEAGKGGGLF
jgi:DEAD/DEAH box helicase domain-containing protein